MIKKSLVAISFLFLGFNSLIADEVKAPNEAPGLHVQTFTITKQNNTTNKTYPTILKANEQDDVIARVSGILKEKHFKEGDLVKKGTLLYKIE
ncbi:hypothetical protein ACN5PA_10730, partial [Aliarcobacter butzleri]